MVWGQEGVVEKQHSEEQFASLQVKLSKYVSTVILSKADDRMSSTPIYKKH